MSDSELVKQSPVEQVQAALGAQHAIHGLFAGVLTDVARKNGMNEQEWLVDWADEHPTTFVKMLVSMTPGLMPTAGHQGDIHLHVHHELKPTELDISPETVSE